MPKRLPKKKVVEPVDVAAKLAEARGACARGDFASALRALLAVWQVVPDPRLADAIAAVGKRAEHGVLVPIEGTDEDRRATWLRLAGEGDPAMRGRLLATLTDTAVAARVKALLAFRDPRTTDRIVQALEEKPSTMHFARDRKPLLLALSRCADPRVVERIAQLREHWLRALSYSTVEGRRQRQVVETSLANARASSPEPGTLSDEDRAVVEAIAASISLAPSAGDAATEAGLRAAVYAAPADDGPRQIYADWLQERGDPRGELIVLQLANRHRAYSGHEHQLARKHDRAWLDPGIAPYVTAVIRYARGFPSELVVASDPPGHPAWSTVESVRGAIPATDEHPMPMLCSVEDVSFAVVARLAALATKPPLERLQIRDERLGDLTTLRLPHLRELDLSTPSVPPSLATAILAIGPLEKLALNAELAELGRWHLAIRATAIGELVLRLDGMGVTCVRDGATLSAVTIRGRLRHHEDLEAIAAQLAEFDHLSKLSLRANASAWTARSRRAMTAVLSRHPALQSDLRELLGI